MYFQHIAGRDAFARKLLPVAGYTLHFQQLAVVFVHKPWGNVMKLCLSDKGIDVVVNQSFLRIVSRQCPFIHPVQVHEVVHQVGNRFDRRRDKSIVCLLVFDFRFSFLGFSISSPCFPLLMAGSLVIVVVIYNRIFALSFCNRCHSFISFDISNLVFVQPVIKGFNRYSD